jgi:hypothetical protein
MEKVCFLLFVMSPRSHCYYVHIWETHAIKIICFCLLDSEKYFGFFRTWAVFCTSLVGFLIVVATQWRPTSDSCFFTQLLVEKILFFPLDCWTCFCQWLFAFDRPWKFFPGLLFSEHHRFRSFFKKYFPNLLFLDCTQFNSIDTRNGCNIQEFFEESFDFEFEVFGHWIETDFLGKVLDFGCYKPRNFLIDLVSICFRGSLLGRCAWIIWGVSIIFLLQNGTILFKLKVFPLDIGNFSFHFFTIEFHLA